MFTEKSFEKPKNNLSQEEIEAIRRDITGIELVAYDLLGSTPTYSDMDSAKVSFHRIDEDDVVTDLNLSFAVAQLGDMGEITAYQITRYNQYCTLLYDEDGSLIDLKTNIDTENENNVHKWLISSYREISYAMGDNLHHFLKTEDPILIK